MTRVEAFGYALQILWDAVPLWVGLVLMPLAIVAGTFARAAVCA
ncbi:MAG TPA: hypothetical protein VFJ93_07710 [Gaiellaceae bacterium]|nr:hypothetical protein [Gaiellaceae bacterium]